MSSEDKKKSIFDRFKEEYIDALQEVGNIGSGHAATALAEFLSRRIDMSLPRFNVLSTHELSTVQWRDKSLASTFIEILVETTGELVMDIMVVFDEDTVMNLLQLVQLSKFSTKDFSLHQLSSLEKSIIKETGNILALHYITAINTFLGTDCFPTSPLFFIESSETILTSIANHFGEDFSHLLLIECDIFTSDMKLSPIVILIPEEKATECTLKILFGEV
ncbi:MAG: chemotaxis protein CheC [Candidatus Hodarchaeota archaeon]